MTDPTLLEALTALADDRGYVRTTVSDLCVEAGLSRASVMRHLSKLEGSGRIRRKGKGGPGGSLVIRIQSVSSVSESVSESVSSVSDHAESFDLGSGSAEQNLEPEPKSAIESVSSVSPSAQSPSWAVCCVWHDDDGVLWSHGDDGTPTYIPCRSEAEADFVAKTHRETLHRGLRTHDGRFPRVDVCDRKGRTWMLHHSFGDIR